MGQAAVKVSSVTRDMFLEDFKDNDLTISPDWSSGVLSDFLTDYFYPEGGVLKISHANVSTDTDHQITIDGIADFMDIPDLPVQATFNFLDNGSIDCRVAYTLIKSGQSSDYWQFRKSFPLMPRRPSTSSPFQGSGRRPFADEFAFREAKIVVCNTASFDEDYQKELCEGVNFLARANLFGSLSIIQHLLDEKAETTIFGKIIRPKLDTNFFKEALKAKQKRAHNELAFPWDYSDSLPGLHLQADIGHDVEVDNLKLGETRLKIYCPFDDWSLYDTIYKPQKAITGSLSIPTANIQMEAFGILTGDSNLTVYTRFEGLSINNLAHLTSSNSDINLESHLPDPVQSVIKKLKKIEVLDLAFTIKVKTASATSKPSLKLSYSTVKIGFRDLNWQIWDEHIVVDDLAFRFELIGGTSTSIRASFTANTHFNDLPITITGTKWGSQYILDISLDDKTTLPFKDFLKRHAPDLPAPGNLTIDNISIEICPGSYITVTGSLAGTPEAWELDIGPTKIEVKDLSFELNRMLTKTAPSSSRMQGFVTGTIEIDGMRIQVNYQLPNTITMNAYIPKIKLSKLQRQLTGAKSVGPSGFDFELTNIQLVAKAGKVGFQFKCLSTVPNLGMLALQAGKSQEGWGAAAGMYLEEPQLSKIEGLEFLSPLDDVIHLKDLTLVVSSIDDAQFQFPTNAEFSGQHALNSSGIRLPQAPTGVTRGLSAHGVWVLNGKDKVHRLLMDTFKLEEGLPVTLQISTLKGKAPSIHLFAEIAGSFENTPFDLQVGLRMQSGAKLEYYVIGTGAISVSKQKMLMNLGVSVTLSGFALSGSLQGTLDIHGLKISDLGFMGSVNWAGLPGFGFTGRINTKAFQSSIVMLLDSANMGMVLAGSISELTAYKVMTAIVGVKNMPKGLAGPLKKIEIRGAQEFNAPKSLSKALDQKDLKSIANTFNKSGGVSLPSSEQDTLLVINQKGKKWFLTNRRDNLKTFQIDLIKNKLRVVVAPQIYICTSYSRIGAVEFQPGFLLSACIRIIDFEAYASIDISPNRGIAIDAYINQPIVIANKNFFIFRNIQGNKGPYLSISTFNQPQHPVVEYRSPHLYMNGRLKVMGLQLECYAEINTSTLKIDANLSLKNTIKTPVIKGNIEYDIFVQAHVGNLKEFYAKFAVAFQVGVDLYLAGVRTLSFKTAIAGSIELGLTNGKPYAKLMAAFKICGENCKTSVKLQPGKDSLNHTGKFLAHEISHFFEDMYKDVEKFVEDVGKGILKGFEETEKLGKVLGDHFGQSAYDVAKAFDSLGHDIDGIAKTLDKQFSKSAQEIGEVLSDIGKPAQDIAKGLTSVGHDIETVGKALTDIGHAPADIAKALTHVNINPSQIAKTLSKLNIKPLDISDAISSLHISSNDVGKALKAVHINTHDIEKSVNGAISDVTEFFEDIGKTITGVFKKKKKRKRKPSPDEICKKLSKVTDNYSFIHLKITKVGHSSTSALCAIIKLKGPPATLLPFLHKTAGNDDNVFRLLRSNGWTDLKVVRTMKQERYSYQRIAVMLKVNGYGPQRINNLFTKARIPMKAYKAAQAHANATVFSKATLYTAHKRFVRAQDGGGKTLKGDAKQAKSHETFQIILVRPKKKGTDQLTHGCKVALMTQNHHYLRADKKGNLSATPTQIGSYEKFTLINHTAKDRPIKKGDIVSLKSVFKKHIVAEKKYKMGADRDKIGSWEKFIIK